jgi:hypothetical protein
MKRPVSMTVIIVLLLVASIVGYLVHYLIFHDSHHIFIFMIHDLAFLPVEVLLVVIVIERLLSYREKLGVMNKLNMVIGTFFSELGSNLLAVLTESIENKGELCSCLAVQPDWTPNDFKKARLFTQKYDYRVNPDLLDFNMLNSLLVEKRDMLVSLLANPNVMEHEGFTDLLWAAFHFMEELSARRTLVDLPEDDKDHLANDALRVYTNLTGRWLLYLQHLQSYYPFMFSLILRTHPLYESVSCDIGEYYSELK